MEAYCSGATGTAEGAPGRQGGSPHVLLAAQSSVLEDALPSWLPWHFPSVHRRMSG